MEAMKTEENCDEKEIYRRVKLPKGDLTIEEIHKLWETQELYINQLEDRLKATSAEAMEEKVKSESSHRENLLLMRLTAKEQEIQELAAQVAQLKSAQAPNAASLRSTLLDPAVNILIQKLTKECENLKKQAEDKQNELAAWKFTPDSATGKRLMAKCRQLYQENDDLGKMISSGRLAKLEGELALQKDYSEKMKQNQLEMDDFMAELDEDVEGMQSTIVFLQKQLRDAKDQIARLSAELGEEDPDKSKQDSILNSHENSADLTETTDHLEEENVEKRKLSQESEDDLEASKRTKLDDEAMSETALST